MSSNPSKMRLIPVPKWKLYHPWPSESGLRWLIYNAERNGFDKVIKRCQGRILIDEEAFNEWVEEKNREHCLSKSHMDVRGKK